MVEKPVSEAMARRAAQRVGLVARKSRGALSNDNHGGFRLVDPFCNRIIAGEKFNLTPEEVVEHSTTA
jgi:hypothetical protein